MDNPRLEMLIFGAHASLDASKVLRALEALDRGKGPAGLARAGAIVAVRDLVSSLETAGGPGFPASYTGLLVWMEETVLDAGGMGPGVEWNDYFLGSWTMAGNTADLAELVRRAKHRDGSTSTLGASGDALTLLSAGFVRDAELRRKLLDLSFDPGAIKFGNHPPGSKTAFTVPVLRTAGKAAKRKK